MRYCLARLQWGFPTEARLPYVLLDHWTPFCSTLMFSGSSFWRVRRISQEALREVGELKKRVNTANMLKSGLAVGVKGLLATQT
jgi:hypothetical protein